MTNSELEYHRSLMEHRQSIDRLFWSRTQTLYAVQAAVLGGAFALKDDSYGWALLLFGAFLTAMLGLLCSYDWQGVKVNESTFFDLCDRLGIYWDAKPSGIRKLLPGNSIFKWVIILFIWINAALAFHLFWIWLADQTVCKTLVIAFLSLVIVGWTIYFNRYWNKKVEKPSRST
jgi:hypothetical protein